MSRDKSFVPSNLLDWPRVANLLPDLKFILQTLWAHRDMGALGAGFLAIGPFSSSLSLKPEAVEAGIKILEKNDLVVFDEKTHEIYILDWNRYNDFKTSIAIKMYHSGLAKIQSQTIKIAIIEKSKGCLPPSPSPSPSSSSPPPPTTGGGGYHAKISTQNHVFSEDELREFGESAVWNANSGSGKQVENQAMYAAAAKKRIGEGDASQTDFDQLKRFKEYKVKKENDQLTEVREVERAERKMRESAASAAAKHTILTRFENLAHEKKEELKVAFMSETKKSGNSLLLPAIQRGLDSKVVGRTLLKKEFELWLCSQPVTVFS